MALPNNADRVVVRGFWWDETTQAGVGGTVTFDPVPLTGTATPNVRDATSYGHIKTRQRIARPDATTGYYAAMLLSSNDPDLDAYGGRKVTFSGETPFIIEVPYNAPTITVDAPLAAALPELHVGDHVKAVWLVDAALITTPPPTPLTSYLSSEQTLGAIADGVEAHDGANDAHPDIRAAITSSVTPDATTSVKGRAKLLGGTADAPTVPYSAVTGAPSSLPPSGGAGGVLSGTFPNPGFANDMATQAELDAVAASIPEAARDALGAALVAGSNVTITPNDGADTITISASVPSAYSDEQAQDAFAALLAAGTHSGISFTYNDAGNAISATVAAPSTANITRAVRSVSANTTAVAGELLKVDALGAARTVTPPSSPVTGAEVIVMKTDISANPVIWSGTVDGDSQGAQLVAQWAAASYVYDGTQWLVRSTNLGAAAVQLLTAVTTTKTANYTAASGELVPVDTTGGAVTVTSPSGGPFAVRWKAGTTGPTVTAAGGFTINGAASTTLSLPPSTSSGELVVFQCFGTDYQQVAGFKPQVALDARHGTVLNTHLLAWAYGQSFRLASATRDANEAITTASVVWPDGSTGTFTTDTASTAFPGAIDAYHVTYVPSSGTTRTITQAAVTRDAGGAVTAQPALTVA